MANETFEIDDIQFAWYQNDLITNMEDYFVFRRWREKFGFDSDEVYFVSSSIEERNSETGKRKFFYNYVDVQFIKRMPNVKYVYIFKIEFIENT